MAEGPAKLRYRRLEPTIQKFVKVAIPTDLERLHKHQINIEKLHTELLAFIHTCIFWDSCVNAEVLTMLSKLCHQLPGCAPMLDSLCILPMHPVDIIFIGIYQRWGQWDKLHQEHINASRTVQQLQANMREMETICLRVRDEDSQALEKIINPVKERAAAAVEEFLKLHSQLSEVHSDHGNVENSQDPHSSLVRSQTIAGTFTGSQDSGSPLHQHSVQLNVPLPQIPQDHDAAESWENLEENLIDLSNLVTEFSQLLHIQQEKIDSIEDHVSTAAENVEEGTKNLAKAAKYKLAMLPVAGALIGGAIGGPIGLLAGFKVAGAAAAVGGGVLGFTGGRMLLKKQQQKIDQELALSSSCPELKTQAGKKS